MHWDESKIFQLLPFYDSYIEKPRIKNLNNVQLFKELPFYDELNIVKNKTAFSGYGRSYNIEIVYKRYVIVQLKASEISIKQLFKDLLIELKVFKYLITLCVFVGSFYEKELQKTNRKEFRIEKVIKRKGNKLYAKWKGYKILLIAGLIKKIL